jgi:hypothetical protein
MHRQARIRPCLQQFKNSLKSLSFSAQGMKALEPMTGEQIKVPMIFDPGCHTRIKHMGADQSSYDF